MMRTAGKKYLMTLALVLSVVLSAFFMCMLAGDGNTGTAAAPEINTYSKETGVSAAAAVAFDHEFWVYGTANNNITLDYMSGPGGTRTQKGTGYTPATCMTNLEAIRLNAPNSAIHFSGDAAGTGTLTVTTAFTFAAATSGNVYIDGNLATTTANINLITNSGTVNLFITDGTISATTGRTINNGSTGEVNISGGTVSATTGPAIHNDKTGKITISQPTTTPTIIRSANTAVTSGTIFLAAGTAGQTILDIRGGTIENTPAADTGRTIHNAGDGMVDISGGTVSAVRANAIYYASPGKLTISQPTSTPTIITSANIIDMGGTIYLSQYKSVAGQTLLDIQGGTIENTAANVNARAVGNNGVGDIEISGGTILANTGIAVYNVKTGKITISQPTTTPTIIRSANVTATQGTIHLTNVAAGTTVLEINGGAIENTAAGGNVIYKAGTNINNIILSGAPVISGRIAVPKNCLSTAAGFNPGSNIYTVQVTGTPAVNDIIVTDGAAFLSSFTVSNSGWALVVSGSDLVLKKTQAALTINSAASVNFGTAYTVTTTGGSGTGAVTYAVVAGGTGSATVNASTGALNIIAAGTIFLEVTKAGDTDYLPITSPTFTLTVNRGTQAAFTITSAPSVNFGTAYTVTSTGGSGTGAVTYAVTPGGTGAATVNTTTGVLTITAAGTVFLEATKAGDTNYNPITATLTLTVNKANQTGFSINSAPTVTFGTAYTVTSTGGNGSGAVTYAVAAGGTGVATVNATTGALTVTTAGTVFLEATKAGDATYNPVTATLTLTVNPGPQAAFTITSAPSVSFGTAYTVASAGGSGTGAVTYAVAAGGTGIATVNAATGALTVTQAGTVFLEATKAGDTNYSPITATMILTVNLGTQAAFTITSASNINFGAAYTVTSTGGTGSGAVTYAVVPGGTGAATVNATTGVLTITQAGTIFLEATKAGDVNYSPITATLTLTVNKTNQAAFTITSAASVNFGDPYTVTSTGGSGSGAVTYAVVSGGTGVATVNATTGALTVTQAGTIFLEAAKAGDATYNPITATLTLTVNKTNQAALTITSAASVNFNTPYTVTSTGGSGTGAVTYAVVPGGTGAATVNAATGALTVTQAGTIFLEATKAGDVNYNPATSPAFTLTVNKTNQAALTITSAATHNIGTPYTVTSAGGSGTGAVTYSIVPGGTGAATVNAATGVLTITAPGTIFLEAAKAGDTNYNAVTSATFTLTVTSIHTVTVINSGNHGTITGGGSYSAGDPVTLTVTVTGIGWEFDKWTSADITIAAGDETNLTLTFTMPPGGVTVTAAYKKIQYGLTADVNDTSMGSLTGDATGNYGYGDSISVTATAKTGYKFVQWNVTGVTLTDPTDPAAAFNMPTNAVTLTAVFAADMRTVTVVSPHGTVTGAGLKQAGSVVTLTLSNIAAGWAYSDWTVANATPTVKNNTTLTFIMPAADVAVTVVFTQIEYNLNVSVNNAAFGSISSAAGVIIGTNQKFYYNDNIDITAIPAPGYRFLRWDVTGAAGDGSTALTLTFSMPGSTVTVQAVFQADSGNVTVTQNPGNYGTVAGDGRQTVGATVTLTLSNITAGWEFDSWGIPASVTNVFVNNATTLEFEMPATGVNITLNFKKIGYPLTVTVNDGSMGSVSPGGGTYEVGDFVSIQATANAGYVFKKWTVTGNATGNNSVNPNLTFNMPAGAVTAEAVFEAKGFNVNVVSAQGTVSGGGNALYGSTVTLTVDSINAGWEFDAWVYTGITPTTENAATLVFTMPNGDITVTAVYKKIQYILTADVNDSTMGEVIDTALPPNVITGGSYTIGEQVVIAANPLPGYQFLGWQGIGSLPGLTQNGTQIKFLMPAGNVTVTAVFGVSQLTVTVTSPDGGISGNNGTYTVGDTVTITAVPNSGYKFTGFTSADITINPSDVTDNGNGSFTLVFTMPGHDVLIIAEYDALSYDVIAVISPAGGGSVSGGGQYKTGETVSLTATAAAGYTFSYWTSADVVILNPASASVAFTMPAGDVTVTAVFVLEDYTITVISPNGTVSGNTGSFNYNDPVTLSVTAQDGYKIIGISCTDPGVDLSGAALGGGTAAVTFNIPANSITVTVTYELIEYTITVIAQNGSVSGAVGTFTVGQSISLAAYPDIGYAFGNWSSADITIAVDTNSVITFNMPARDITITALFTKEDYSVTVITPFGYVTGNENTFNVGDTVTLTLTLQGGYAFMGWSSTDVPSIDGSMSLTITFTMPARSVTITALFDVILYDLTVVSDHGAVSGGKPQYASGDQVSLTAAPDPGYVFDRWESSDIVITNPNSITLTFLMPGHDVTVTAVYRLEDYILTVDAGLGNVQGNNGSYYGGDTVTLTALSTPGLIFDHWESGDITISDPTNSSLTFNMPYHNVTVKAVFIAEGFTVTVTSYYGSITFDKVFTVTDSDYVSVYEAGDLVNIIASALPGYKFVRYISSEVAFKLPPSEDDTFVMPAKNVYITAIYIEHLEVRLTGTEYCEFEGEGQYKSGDYVSITVTPKPGYRLIGWESDDIQISTTPVVPNPLLSPMSVGAVSVTLMPSYTIYFLMPSYSVHITPIFEEVALEDFELDKQTGSGAAGDQIQLNPVFTPGDATGEIVWSSSDTSVATVDQNGLVTITGAGTAVITAVCNGIVREFTVTGTAPGKTPDLLWLWVSLGGLALLLLILIIVLLTRKKREPLPLPSDEEPDRIDEKPDNTNEKPDNASERPANVSERPISINEKPASIEDKPINITVSNAQPAINVVLNSGSGSSNSGGNSSGGGKGSDSGTSPAPAAAVPPAGISAEEAELNRIVLDMAAEAVEAASTAGAGVQPAAGPVNNGNPPLAGTQPVNVQYAGSGGNTGLYALSPEAAAALNAGGVKFSEGKTHAEKYALLTQKVKKLYDEVKDCAISKEGVRITENRSFEKFSIGNSLLLQMEIPQKDMIPVLKIGLIDEQYKKYLKQKGTDKKAVKDKPVEIKLTSPAQAAIAKDTLNFAYSRIMEMRKGKKPTDRN